MRPGKVTTDGSCYAQGREKLGLPPDRGCGGWAAIVEHGSEGYVLRGSAKETTATRMELYAVIRGLRLLPAGCDVHVLTDCLLVQRLQEGLNRKPRRAREDTELHRQLLAEFARLGKVRVEYVRKRDRVSAHERAHVIAGEEARRLAVELGQIKEGKRKAESKAQRRALAAQVVEMHREDDVRRARQISSARAPAVVAD